MIANIQGVMAESPTLLGLYLKLWRPFAKSSLSPVEQQVVLLAAAFENDCDYRVPAHTGLARKLGVDEATIARRWSLMRMQVIYGDRRRAETPIRRRRR